MNTELVCVVASIGYNDGDEYFKSVDCIGDEYFLKQIYHIVHY